MARLNAPCNDDDAKVLRRHIREAHHNLLHDSGGLGGPLPKSGLSEIPNDVLAAIHVAAHTHLWRDHDDDTWVDV